MASHGSRSPSPSPPTSNRRMKGCARRCERACCAVATYFPLAFVYGLTTWAVWVDARIGFHTDDPEEQLSYSKKIPSAIGVVLYILLNASYTTAVFTDPGSPTQSSPSSYKRGRYSILPTTEPHDLDDVQTITVSSTGSPRYCKKCHVSKPDRAHHCSTCKRCVLKMDHHCPWLATCLGLHNYKAFVLFLIYVSLFCWACFLNTSFWVYEEIFSNSQYLDQFAPVNVILLAVLSGIIGLVITGFTGWHIYLCVRGQTTIECLEKTRYLSGVRKQVEANRQEHAAHSRSNSDSLATNLKRIGDQVLEFHANAVPGASRFEEGEEHRSPTPSERLAADDQTSSRPFVRVQPVPSDSPAQRALRSTYTDYESQRETDRYEEYINDQESSKLPNAFDLGWRKNLSHLFGPNPLLWWLPVCNTTGDGWRWQVSDRWARANEQANRRREERLRDVQAQATRQSGSQLSHSDRVQQAGSGNEYYDGQYESSDYRHHHPHPHPQHSSGSYPDRSINDGAVSMHTLESRRSNGSKMRRDFDTSAEGEVTSYQVSGSEDEGDSDSDSDDDIGQMGSRSRSQREDDGGGDGDGWGRQW